ncbi:MAG: hypothetical protein RLZZ09_456 [Pseudomonadota bacterium]
MNTHLPDAAELGHDEAVLLLPWLANGSLEATESVRLLHHAETCEACHSEIRAIRQLYAQLQTEVISIPDAQTSLDGFKQQRRAKIGESRQQNASSRSHNVSRRRGRWLARSGLMRMAAAAIVLLALLPLSYQLYLAQEPQYRTLSDRQEKPVQELGDVRLILDPQLGADQVEKLLATAGAQRLGEADAQGVVTVRLMGSNGAKADVPAIIAWLRQQPGVLFAEPANDTVP